MLALCGRPYVKHGQRASRLDQVCSFERFFGAGMREAEVPSDVSSKRGGQSSEVSPARYKGKSALAIAAVYTGLWPGKTLSVSSVRSRRGRIVNSLRSRHISVHCQKDGKRRSGGRMTSRDAEPPRRTGYKDMCDPIQNERPDKGGPKRDTNLPSENSEELRAALLWSAWIVISMRSLPAFQRVRSLGLPGSPGLLLGSLHRLGCQARCVRLPRSARSEWLWLYWR